MLEWIVMVCAGLFLAGSAFAALDLGRRAPWHSRPAPSSFGARASAAPADPAPARPTAHAVLASQRGPRRPVLRLGSSPSRLPGTRGVYAVEKPGALRAHGANVRSLGGMLYAVEFPTQGVYVKGPLPMEVFRLPDGSSWVATPASHDPERPWRLDPGPVVRDEDGDLVA